MHASIPSYLKLLKLIVLLSLLIGSVALAVVMTYSIVVALQSGGTHLPLILMSDALRFQLDLEAASWMVFVGYYLLFLAIGLSALFFLFCLYRTLALVKANARFVADLSPLVRDMGFAILVIAYLKQGLWFLAVEQLPVAYTPLVSFSFQLIPEQAIYAVLLLVLSRLFRYAQLLQDEQDLTV
jgi:hypothetical protein